ncbi:MAG TPA: NADPH-dependent F420 reductase [Blastocatellia bacterium]|nr:NADPH-dependent F420 reductase [Blastocatellia bacterium]
MTKPDELRIGLIGGTGDEGRGLALRWAMAGAHVMIGSRSVERAKSAADGLNLLLGDERIEFGDNETAVTASDLVLLTVPFDHAASTLESHRGDFREGAILIDITVPVSFDKGRARYVEPPEGSASEHLRARLPESVPLVAAFKTEPAHLLVDPTVSLDCDVFVAGDSKDAKVRVIDAIKLIGGLRPIDAGGLESCRAIERMTVLLIGINRRYKVKTGRFRVVGLE